mgnify:CR=1 FL=1
MNDIDALYRAINAVLPTWSIAALALFAVVSSIAHAFLRGNARALILACGAIVVLFIYAWLQGTQTTALQRTVAIKIAIIAPLVSIALFNEQAWPWLSSALKRAWRRTWGGR